MARRRRGFLLRFVIGAVLVLLVVAVAAVGAAAWLIDPNAFKPQIEAAVQRATGRTLTLRGPIRIAYRLPPGIVAKDLTLANPPGFSRPEMARIGTLEAHVALLPLLSGRVEITSIVLIGPDVLLERDAAGHDNWHFTPPERPASAPAAGEATGSRPPRFAIGAVHVRQGQLGWRDAASGRSATLGVPRLDLTPSGTETIAVTGDLLADGRTLALTGEVGSVAHLLDPAAATPWPVQLVLQGEAARLAVRGTIAHPLQGTGYALQVDLAATDLAPFAAFLPVPPPKLHDAAFSARLVDTGAKLPEVTAMTLHVAGLALGAVAIERADITAPGLTAPLNAEVHGAVAGQKLAMKATIGALAATLGVAGAKPAPVPVEASGTAGGAQFVVKGTLADPARLAGADLAFALRIADFAALRPLAGRDLPPWKDVALDGRIGGDLEGQGPLTLRGLALTTPPVQATGDLELRRGPHPALRGTIAAQHLDLDPLLAAFAPPPAAPTAATPPAAPAKPTHLIPDTPLDFAALRAGDADLQLAVAALTAGGVRYSDLAGHLVLKDGHLTLDPIAATAPGGRVEGRLSADAATSDVALTLRAPALALQPLAAALGQPEAATGTAFLDADLRGHGTSPHAIAATLSGRLGLGTQDAEIENAYLAKLVGSVLRAAKVPESALGGAGRTRLRCAALRLNASNGKADIAAFALDAGRVQVQGSGTIELGPETLALRPMVRVGSVEVPVRVGGTLRDPKPVLDPAALSRTALRSLLGERGGAKGVTCPAALAAAQAH
jgi:uncharacterized protein involved in outer membrane biogenesis